MKKTPALFFLLVLIPSVLLAASKETRFPGSGEVTSVDPLYGRITIKHGAIKNYARDTENDFFVRPPTLLKGLAKRDLVSFTVIDEKGDVRIEEIKKTGEALLKEEPSFLGQAVQDTLVATGEAAKTLSSPLTPVHEVVSGAVGAATGATGSALEDPGPQAKKKF